MQRYNSSEASCLAYGSGNTIDLLSTKVRMSGKQGAQPPKFKRYALNGPAPEVWAKASVNLVIHPKMQLLVQTEAEVDSGYKHVFLGHLRGDHEVGYIYKPGFPLRRDHVDEIRLLLAGNARSQRFIISCDPLLPTDHCVAIVPSVECARRTSYVDDALFFSRRVACYLAFDQPVVCAALTEFSATFTSALDKRCDFYTCEAKETKTLDASVIISHITKSVRVTGKWVDSGEVVV